MVRKLVSRLENRNTSPNRTGQDDIDEEEEIEEDEPQTSTSRHRSASHESIETNRTNGGNEDVMCMMVEDKRQDRQDRQEDRRRQDEQRREDRDDRRRQEDRMVQMMQMMHGHNGPQITVNVRPPRPFYGNEDKETLDFDEWLITVDSYVQQSGQNALIALTDALEDAAREAFHSIPAVQRGTYEEAVVSLRPLVKPVMSKNVAALRLLDLEREPGESVEAAMQRYLCLKNKTNDRHIVRASWLRMMDSRITEKMLITLGPDKDDIKLREVMELTVTKAHIFFNFNISIFIRHV